MQFNRIIIAVSFAWLLVSWWNRNEIPGTVDYVAELANEPVQKRTQKRPFELIFNDASYQVEPEYEYDITGMIVSYRHHEGNSRMHYGDKMHMEKQRLDQ